jgi:acetyl esterase/lipase
MSRSAVRYLKANAEKYHLDTKRFAAMGGSAGGNLSAMLAVSSTCEQFDDPAGINNDQSCSVAAAVDWFGPVDFKTWMHRQERTASVLPIHDEAHSPESQYLGIELAKCPKEIADSAGPFPYISKDMAPILIEHGSKDRFVPPAQSEKLFHAITEKAGTDKAEFHVLAEADHGDPMFEEDYNMQTVRVFLSRVFESEVK